MIVLNRLIDDLPVDPSPPISQHSDNNSSFNQIPTNDFVHVAGSFAPDAENGLEEGESDQGDFDNLSDLDENDFDESLAEGDDNSDQASEWAKKSVSPELYSYLKGAVDDVCKSVDGKKQSPPDCYSNGSFWIHAPDPVFSACNSNKTGGSGAPSLNPFDFCKPSIFVWLPRVILGKESKIPYPKCRNCENTESHGFEFPRRVIGLNRIYFVLSRRYICKGCPKRKPGRNSLSFMPHDPRVCARCACASVTYSLRRASFS